MNSSVESMGWEGYGLPSVMDCFFMVFNGLNMGFIWFYNGFRCFVE